MKIKDIILEMSREALTQLASIKTNIASKIKELPDDDATIRALIDIEDLLSQVSAGGRSGYVDKKLQEIDDDAVNAYRKVLARYILSISAGYEPKLREELFDMWKSDKIVNIDKLLSKKEHDFSELFNGYKTNPLMKEFIDDVMSESGLGQGKGEFGLNVLSKRITKPGQHAVNIQKNKKKSEQEKPKGDLLVNGRKIEVKTTDGGSARFTDQEVAPAEGYTQAAVNLKSFAANLGVKMSTTGLNGKQAFELGQQLKNDKSRGPQFFALVQDVIEQVFGGSNADQKMINKIMTAFESGDLNNFLQYYSQASLEYYLGQKEDEGVLAINLKTKKVVYYQNAQDLSNVAQRLDAKTFYLTNTKDKRMPYPQLEVIPTTFGANAVKQAKKQNVQVYTQALPQAQDPVELEQDLQTIISDLADAYDITDPTQINNMMNAASEWLAKQKNKEAIAPDSLKDYLQRNGFLTPKQQGPDELDTIVKNAGITKPTAPAQPGPATV
jgi:hypothetical protein